ncbi:MAG: HD domain-containing protein [Gemmataceae bacterium]|nr:HD domain-containing protein [Gemmataceae bacterium]
MTPDPIPAILDALRLAERLKFELRHSWTSEGRRESVAEHSYQMALMAVLLHPHLEHPVDLCRTLKLVLVHDLVEAEAGDVVWFSTGEAKDRKAERERAAIARLRELLPPPSGDDVYALWHEFEDGLTAEARFARSLDYLEVQVQHNLAPLETWEPVEYGLAFTKPASASGHDGFLRAFAAALADEAGRKLAAGGVDVAAVRAAAGVTP